MKASHVLSALLPVFIAFLMLSPVNAAPTLSAGSHVSYHVSGTVTSSQNCTSANITVGGIACGNSQQQFQPTPFVSAFDDGHCTTYGTTSCRFSPNSLNVSTGTNVNWSNAGNSSIRDGVRHTVTSDTGLFDLTLPLFNQTFFSGGQFFVGPQSFTFNSAGSFLYHCKNHSWMTGKVVVTTPTIPPAKVQSYSLSGNVGWTAVDLDDNAQLKVTHSIDVFNASSSSSPKIYSDSGTSVETVSLADRKDTSVIANPFFFLYGFQTGPGPSLNPFPSFGYNPYGSNGYYGYPPLESYTLWWMNGPLTATSTVEVLSFQAGVGGSQTVDLSSSLGSKEAWIVSTESSQQSSQTVPVSQFNNYCYNNYYGGGPFGAPQQTCFNSAQSNSLNLSLLYGKQSDLLLSFSSSTNSMNEQTTRYPPGAFLYGPFGGQGLRVSSQVDVIRTNSAQLSLSLTLDSTNLDLSKRMTLPAPSTTSTPTSSGTPGSNASPANGNSMFTSPLWLYGTIGIVAGLIVSGAVWGMLRPRHKAGAPNIGTATPPTSLKSD